MKYRFLILSIFFFSSCSKNDNESINTPATFQFKVNGQLIQLSGGLDSSHRDPITGYFYGCFATKFENSGFYSVTAENATYKTLLEIETQQDSLLPTTYSGGFIDPSFFINDSVYGINAGDAMSITISRYSHGTIDGTFSGTVSDLNLTRKTITEGQFNNLKVNY